MMRIYLLAILGLTSCIHAADKKQEDQVESLAHYIEQCKQHMCENLERSEDSREALDKTLYMKEYLHQKQMLGLSEQELRDLQNKAKKNDP